MLTNKIKQGFKQGGGNMIFTVNNQEWQLKFVNPNSNELMRSDGSITLGMTDNNVKTVYINNKLNNYMTDKVLAHELTHVFAFEFDYFIPIETEEIVADFMSLYGRDIVYLLDDLVGILKKAYIA
jgi:hypothetical protein